VGPPDRCAQRLRDLAALGIDRFVLTGPSFGGDREAGRLSARLVTHELLPMLGGSRV
jgi:alkanesulfonate monooxygenase SsuD/methylene tetrahydromethanopterin reductase-like flavin-dependent oxidoreductase (luciferase family)